VAGDGRGPDRGAVGARARVGGGVGAAGARGAGPARGEARAGACYGCGALDHTVADCPMAVA
jgi:hypothetical protein